MLITGLEGPITIASAERSASSTSFVGSASAIPSSSIPCTSGSSPVLAITERSEPISSCIPAASLAPPVPPARRAILIAERLGPVVAVGQAGQLDPGVSLVAGVDRDQHRRQLLDDAGHL